MQYSRGYLWVGGVVLSDISMQKMAKWFKKSIVTYNPLAVSISNGRVSEKAVVERLPFKYNIDDIQKTITNYEKPTNPNAKIGMVVSVEYFQRKPKEAAAYVIFFDISNGAIITSERIVPRNVSDGKSSTAYWPQSFQFFI